MRGAGGLRPAAGWFRVIVEGEADPVTPLASVREARLHFNGQRESLARQWGDAAISALIQQGGF